MLGLPAFLEVTVESDSALDFSEFDYRQHSGVLLDGVGDAAALWQHREVLQGRPKRTRGGRSATMVYSYEYSLAMRAVVATLDLTAANLDWFASNHWLKSADNVCLVRLTAPAWRRADVAARSSEARRAQKI